MQMLLSKLQACRVEEEVVKPQHEHACLPIVALDGSADNDDLLERVVDLVEWTLLLSELLGIGDVVGGLQVDVFAASVAHEVDLQLPALGLPITSSSSSRIRELRTFSRSTTSLTYASERRRVR